MESLRNIALKIAYQGQGFAGWQCQPQQRTVEEELRRALGLLHDDGAKIQLYGAGRTDSGVHASGQVANFTTQNQSIPGSRFREALNARLPKDVRILQSREVEPGFHARYSARARAYEYRIIQNASPPPEQRQHAWYLRAPQLDTGGTELYGRAVSRRAQFSCVYGVGGSGQKEGSHHLCGVFLL